MLVARTVVAIATVALGVASGLSQDLKSCLAQYEKDLAALAEERQATIKSLSDVYADNLESLLAQAKKDGDAALQQEASVELERFRKGEAVSGGGPPKHPDLKAARAKHEEALRLRDRGTPHKTDRLVLRRVESGTFAMGSPETETGRRPDERRHRVTLTRAYYIGGSGRGRASRASICRRKRNGSARAGRRRRAR